MNELCGSIALSDPATFTAGVPHDLFARLRRAAPVVWIDEVPLWLHSAAGDRQVAGSGYWAVLSHAAVMSAARQSTMFSSALRGAFFANPKSRDDLVRTQQLLISMDEPEHSRLRAVVKAAFTQGDVQRLHQSIRLHAEQIVADASERQEFDVVHDIAARLPLLVLADLLGMPRADWGLFLSWSNNLVGFDDADIGRGSVERYQQTYVEALQYARELAALRRRQPTDDLTSRLVSASLDGHHLTDSEFSSIWLLLLVGGNESTRHLLSGSIHALDESPDERRRLIDSPALTSAAVEELLRYVSPTMQFRRTAASDVTLEGVRIRKDDKVVLYYTSANRDTAVFTAPDRLDLSRTPNPHLAFGFGPHFCLGARLARVEAATLLDVMRPLLARLELTGPPVRLQSNFMNGIKSLPARFAQ